MARQIPNDPDCVSASVFGAAVVVARSFGIARFHVTSSSTKAIPAAPQGVAVSGDVGAKVPTSFVHGSRDRK